MAVLKVLFYLIVLILVLVLAYITTRMLGRGMNGRQQSGDMKILDRLAVGRDSYLMIVDVQGRILLVGVSPAGITRLEELETYEKKSPAEVSPDFASVFTEQLKTLVKKTDGSRTEDRRETGETYDEGEKENCQGTSLSGGIYQGVRGMRTDRICVGYLSDTGGKLRKRKAHGYAGYHVPVSVSGCGAVSADYDDEFYPDYHCSLISAQCAGHTAVSA